MNSQNFNVRSSVRELHPLRVVRILLLLCALAGLSGCTRQKAALAPLPGQLLPRQGDEIVACGQLFHTGTPVVLWMDPKGYDAYRVERRFAPFQDSSWEKSSEQNKNLKSPNRYNLRSEGLSPAQIEEVRGGGWDLRLLQQVVDQFVMHYDVSGTSKNCFTVLHDHRCLSIHFMLDLDGTIYQTLDLKERAWHATSSNTRSIGIEIANIGAYAAGDNSKLEQWYARDAAGRMRVTIPPRFGDGGFLTPGFTAYPSRNDAVEGVIQGQSLRQYDFTPQQYEALIKLTAALCTVFPKIQCDYPRDESGALVPGKLPDDRLEKYQGLLGHYHIQTNKVDPGPAFQWERVVQSARALMSRK